MIIHDRQKTFEDAKPLARSLKGQRKEMCKLHGQGSEGKKDEEVKESDSKG